MGCEEKWIKALKGARGENQPREKLAAIPPCTLLPWGTRWEDGAATATQGSAGRDGGRKGAAGLKASPGTEAELLLQPGTLQDQNHLGTAVPAFVSSPRVLVCLG